MSTLVVLPDLENMGMTVGISLLLRTQPKIQVLYMYFRFMAAYFDFLHGFLSSVIFVIGSISAVLKT